MTDQSSHRQDVDRPDGARRRTGTSGLPAEHVLQPDPRDVDEHHDVADRLNEVADDEMDPSDDTDD